MLFKCASSCGVAAAEATSAAAVSDCIAVRCTSFIRSTGGKGSGRGSEGERERSDGRANHPGMATPRAMMASKTIALIRGAGGAEERERARRARSAAAPRRAGGHVTRSSTARDIFFIYCTCAATHSGYNLEHSRHTS